jgi:hypothetical protein
MCPDGLRHTRYARRILDMALIQHLANLGQMHKPFKESTEGSSGHGHGPSDLGLADFAVEILANITIDTVNSLMSNGPDIEADLVILCR